MLTSPPFLSGATGAAGVPAALDVRGGWQAALAKSSCSDNVAEGRVKYSGHPERLWVPASPAGTGSWARSGDERESLEDASFGEKSLEESSDECDVGPLVPDEKPELFWRPHPVHGWRRPSGGFPVSQSL